MTCPSSSWILLRMLAVAQWWPLISSGKYGWAIFFRTIWLIALSGYTDFWQIIFPYPFPLWAKPCDAGVCYSVQLTHGPWWSFCRAWPSPPSMSSWPFPLRILIILNLGYSWAQPSWTLSRRKISLFPFTLTWFCTAYDNIYKLDCFMVLVIFIIRSRHLLLKLFPILLFSS